MSLSEIVTSSIQAGTVNPARTGFGIPLLMSYHTAWADDEVRTYTSSAGVLSDFAATSMQYLWAAAMLSQNPRPARILIGRAPVPATGHQTTITFTDMASGTAIAGSVVTPAGVSTAIAVPWNTDLATTLADFETAIEAISGVASVTITGGNTAVVLATAGAGMFHFSFTTAGVHVRETTADWAYDTALAAAAVRNGTFYVIHSDTNSPQNMDKIARWALANDRLAFFGPQYTKPSQFVTGEFAAGADYTALMANDAAVIEFTKASRRNFGEAGWTGRMLPLEPGSATWAYKAKQGIGADDWTATERALIEASAHSGNHYTAVRDVGITRPGKTAGGEWIDVVIGLAWVEARIQEGLFAALVNNPKIPYTDTGLGQLKAVVRGVLKEAESRSILAAGWDVTVTAVADQATADRAARIVRGLDWSAQLAGAVHTINVIGTVSA